MNERLGESHRVAVHRLTALPCRQPRWPWSGYAFNQRAVRMATDHACGEAQRAARRRRM